METTAILRSVRLSPQKGRLIADMIRGLPVERALEILQFNIISKSLDHIKKSKRKKRFAFVQSLFGTAGEEEIHPEEFNHPGVVMENKERAAELFKAMEQLPDNQRIAFTLHKLEAQKHQDIAVIMNLSLTAVESLIARAKGNLRKTLNAYYIKNNF